MDAFLSKMVRAVEAPKLPLQQSELLRQFGKDLLARPDLCAALIQEAGEWPIVGRPDGDAGRRTG